MLDRCDVLCLCCENRKTCIIVIRGVAIVITFDLKIALARETCGAHTCKKCLSLEKKKRVLKLAAIAVEMT